MSNDPIVEEIRKIRHAHAEKFNNDVAAIFADYRRVAKESGRQPVSFPPRPPGPWELALLSKTKRKRKAKRAKT